MFLITGLIENNKKPNHSRAQNVISAHICAQVKYFSSLCAVGFFKFVLESIHRSRTQNEALNKAQNEETTSFVRQRNSFFSVRNYFIYAQMCKTKNLLCLHTNEIIVSFCIIVFTFCATTSFVHR